MVDQGGRQDPTENSGHHEQRRGAYQLSHVYDNLLLSVATSCGQQKFVPERQL